MLDLGNVPYIALDDRFGVIQEPFLSARPGRALESLGIAAGQHTLQELLADDGFTPRGRLSLQNSPEKFAGAAAKLALRERQQNFRRALNLSDDRTVETPNGTHRIGPSRVEGRLIIQSRKGHLAIGKL